MTALRSIAVAFGMYSRIPMPRIEWTEASMRYALAAFPLVGVVQGLVCLCWGLLCAHIGLPREIASAGLLMIPIVVNGGIHLDGLADTTDALASHAPRKRKLEILKDSSCGAFAVIAVASYLIVAFALLAYLPLDAPTLAALGCSFALSRALSGIAVAAWPSARPSGTAGTFSKNASKRVTLIVLAVWAVAACAALVFLRGPLGAACACAGLIVFGIYRVVAMRTFGGVTGDLAGWFVQYAEIAMCAVLATGGMLA